MIEIPRRIARYVIRIYINRKNRNSKVILEFISRNEIKKRDIQEIQNDQY